MSFLSKRIEIFHRINRLKIKAGGTDDSIAGFIDPDAIRRAQGAIEKKRSEYDKQLEEVMIKIDAAWDDIKNDKKDTRLKSHINKLHNYANNIKDLAETYSYKLMEHFGKSLRDFCEKLDRKKPEHLTIVQAHIDVMWVAYNHEIKDDGGPEAAELRLILAKAIEQHG